MNSVLGHSFTFRGIDFAAYGALVEEFEFPESAVPTISVIQTAQGDAYFDPINDTPRVLQLNLGVWHETRAEFVSRIRAIKRLTDPSLHGPGILRIDKFNDIDLYAVRTGAITLPPLGLKDAKFPLLWTVLQRDYGRTLLSGSGTFTGASPNVSLGTPEGDHYARVVWYFQNNQGSELANTTIQLRNGDVPTELLEWTGTLEDTRWLKFGLFNTDKQYSFFIGKSTAGGADPRALTYVDASLNLTKGIHPMLQGGIANTMVCTGPSTGKLEWDYYPRY